MGEWQEAWRETLVSTYSVKSRKPNLSLKFHQEGTKLKQIVSLAHPVFSPAQEQNFFGHAHGASLCLETLLKSTYL